MQEGSVDERTRGKDKDEREMPAGETEEEYGNKRKMVGKEDTMRVCGKRRKKKKKKIKIRGAPLAISLHPSLLSSPSPSHPHPLFLSGSHSLLLSPTPLLLSFFSTPLPFFFSPLAPFSPTSLSPLLLLTPSLVCLLIRAGGTIVPLLPVFGNPGLKQSLFTQAVAEPGPSPSLQPGQVWLSLFRKCYNKPLSQPLRLIHSPLSFRSLPPSLSPTLPPLSLFHSHN